MAAVEFTLNGKPASVEAGEAPLLFVLRNALGLKATRFGCGLEACGACVVSVDGKARYSCTLPVDGLAGAVVITAEGLMDDPVGKALVEAFLTEQAGQCGYCLPGILMASFCLLKREPAPDRAAIVSALDAHLCRCGAHGGILRAVERAARTLATEAA